MSGLRMCPPICTADQSGSELVPRPTFAVRGSQWADPRAPAGALGIVGVALGHVHVRLLEARAEVAAAPGSGPTMPVDGGWWVVAGVAPAAFGPEPPSSRSNRNVSENLAAWNFPAPGLGRLSEAAWTAGSPFPTGRTTSLPTPNPSRRSISSARHSGSKTVCSSFCGPLDMLQTVKFLPEERSTGAGCCPPKKELEREETSSALS
ncbi:uncharacterized protein LOC119866938 isoform X3 [Canis lupus familiaris]|uniref:uncharacterized protein LOC119866938 isoform X3 n=1 Tax=Canis lupus familiaris TaxID=9615 RepID=UPI0018F7893F|nr:uncharacterized protein LOC119866938 isoform X3 [Canis lupus familiaris]